MRIILIYFFKFIYYTLNMEKNSEQILSDHNVSITNPRILVLETLLENKGPITLDELQKVLKNKVAKSTLYRVLNDLKKIGILDEFTSPENQTVIELILEDRTHHHHLFCSDCGEIIDVELSDEFENFLNLEIKKIEEKFKFKISDHRVEMFGQCTDQCENCKR